MGCEAGHSKIKWQKVQVYKEKLPTDEEGSFYLQKM